MLPPSFSERVGLVEPRAILQIDSIDDALRNSIWNALLATIWAQNHYTPYGSRYALPSQQWDHVPHMLRLARNIYCNFLKEPTDTVPPNYSSFLKEIRGRFFRWPWNRVYDFVEFMADFSRDYARQKFGADVQVAGKNFIIACNDFLERELAGYRIVDLCIAPITNKEEIHEVEQALRKSDKFLPVRIHLARAIELLSNREKPDPRNSIKESISAVEAAVKIITEKPNATLSDALKLLEAEGVCHGALKNAYNSLYGYTSGADGIRHSLMEESKAGIPEGRFMLIACSAFTNYLISRVGSE